MLILSPAGSTATSTFQRSFKEVILIKFLKLLVKIAGYLSVALEVVEAVQEALSKQNEAQSER